MLCDEELIRLCYLKKRNAQQQLFEKYKSRVMGICLRYAKDHMEADDILQETFVKIFKSLEKMNSGEIRSLDAWIIRIVVNTAIDFATRDKYKQSFKFEVREKMSLLVTDETPLDHLALNDLLKLIQSMPTGYKLVFNLYIIEGYDHREISRLLDISESSSRSQLTRAKFWLQDVLKKNGNEYERVRR